MCVVDEFLLFAEAKLLFGTNYKMENYIVNLLLKKFTYIILKFINSPI